MSKNPSSVQSDGRKEKVSKDKVVLENEEDKSQGNFWHFRHKKKKYFYEDILKGPDRFFHLDVGTECDTFFRGRQVKYKTKKTEIFYHVVDLDHHEYHKIVFHSYLNIVLQSAFFRFGILLLVLLSAVLIGFTTFPDTFESLAWGFNIADQVILSIFIFEIVVKWMYDFRLFWTVAWNVLDFVIVALILYTSVFPSEGGGGSKAVVIVRVVRAFRSLKSMSSLASLSIVTHTVVKSAIDMGNILLVLIVFMLVLSVMGVILFDLPDLNEHREMNYFLNALDAWFVLFICVTQDGWNSVSEFYRDETERFGLLAVYLIFAVSIGSFVFANLIVAVIVANLELSVKELREEKLLSDDPLDAKSVSIKQLDIISMYELLSNQSMSLNSQRPMKIPSLKHISLRRIQTYISLIVALEQNMLESEIIHLDYEKVMAVILSIILQLDFYSEPVIEKEKEEGHEVMEGLKRMSIFPNEKVDDALDRMERAALLSKFKHKQNAQAQMLN